MKKRIVIFVIVVAMLLSSVSSVAFAADEDMQSYSGVEETQDSLKSAIEAEIKAFLANTLSGNIDSALLEIKAGINEALALGDLSGAWNLVKKAQSYIDSLAESAETNKQKTEIAGNIAEENAKSAENSAQGAKKEAEAAENAATKADAQKAADSAARYSGRASSSVVKSYVSSLYAGVQASLAESKYYAAKNIYDKASVIADACVRTGLEKAGAAVDYANKAKGKCDDYYADMKVKQQDAEVAQAEAKKAADSSRARLSDAIDTIKQDLKDIFVTYEDEYGDMNYSLTDRSKPVVLLEACLVSAKAAACQARLTINAYETEADNLESNIILLEEKIETAREDIKLLEEEINKMEDPDGEWQKKLESAKTALDEATAVYNDAKYILELKQEAEESSCLHPVSDADKMRHLQNLINNNKATDSDKQALTYYVLSSLGSYDKSFSASSIVFDSENPSSFSFVDINGNTIYAHFQVKENTNGGRYLAYIIDGTEEPLKHSEYDATSDSISNYWQYALNAEADMIMKENSLKFLQAQYDGIKGKIENLIQEKQDEIDECLAEIDADSECLDYYNNILSGDETSQIYRARMAGDEEVIAEFEAERDAILAIPEDERTKEQQDKLERINAGLEGNTPLEDIKENYLDNIDDEVFSDPESAVYDILFMTVDISTYLSGESLYTSIEFLNQLQPLLTDTRNNAITGLGIAAYLSISKLVRDWQDTISDEEIRNVLKNQIEYYKATAKLAGINVISGFADIACDLSDKAAELAQAAYDNYLKLKSEGLKIDDSRLIDAEQSYLTAREFADKAYEAYQNAKKSGMDADYYAMKARYAADNKTDKPDPYMISGDGNTHKLGDSSTLTFQSSGDYSKFTGIAVDNVSVAPSNYESWSGSTYVKLSAGYLNSLSVGDHTFTMLYSDGKSCSAVFKIIAADETAGSVKTGDNSDNLIYLIVIVCAACAVSVCAAGLIIRKKKNNN